jgi:hypothetical protein
LTARTIQFKGDPGHTMASLKRIGNDTIEETDKRDGKVVGVFKMTVSPDGKWINIEYKKRIRSEARRLRTRWRNSRRQPIRHPPELQPMGARLATVSAANC